jgi:hypothetical protein
VVSPSVFALVLAVGAAALALWIIVRFANFGPSKILSAVIQAVIACVLLELILPTGFDVIDGSGLPAGPYLQVFGVALPLLVYAFLTGGWTMRLAMGLLR